MASLQTYSSQQKIQPSPQETPLPNQTTMLQRRSTPLHRAGWNNHTSVRRCLRLVLQLAATSQGPGSLVDFCFGVIAHVCTGRRGGQGKREKAGLRRPGVLAVSTTLQQPWAGATDRCVRELEPHKGLEGGWVHRYARGEIARLVQSYSLPLPGQGAWDYILPTTRGHSSAAGY